ncbi:hypothetical protein [Clostridium saccharoperbutylacetonicum]|uniref:hypothetical protein n=1 Tax=Clostridium saccharoperbutylacetonicum TaxID=36745 RepID=UPI000983E636|nr:hypothetical protein [Clostridium saccharoperbutylacetonicum]AQR94262.1 hypothetical protein CLSAP_15690 [Clostridium saccharoperbutylacetonicum]NSB29962.1 hypothetical protein [Clostridium saccharoperbutylacetonicum]
MKQEVPIFSDYNMIKKLMFMPLFIFICGFPVFLIICTKNEELGSICFFILIELISLILTIAIYTDHVSVYSDKIESGNVFLKKTTLFKAISKLDIKLVQESYRGKKYDVLYAIFFSHSGQELIRIKVKYTLLSTNRIADIITVIKNYNNKIELSKEFIKYFNENTNYKKIINCNMVKDWFMNYITIDINSAFVIQIVYEIQKMLTIKETSFLLD